MHRGERRVGYGPLARASPTVAALVADAAFGLGGLALLSAATSTALGRAGSLTWMLPYTVGTTVGCGLVAARDLRAAAAEVGRWRPG